MSDKTRELAEGIIDGVMASVDWNGELDPGYRVDTIQTVMKLIASHTDTLIAGAVTEEARWWYRSRNDASVTAKMEIERLSELENRTPDAARLECTSLALEEREKELCQRIAAFLRRHDQEYAAELVDGMLMKRKEQRNDI